MPLLDMPIEKLREYKGINPCPADFDEYWERALKEMRETDLQVELIPADYQVPFAECFDLYFTGVKGAFLDTAQLAGIDMDMPEVDKNRVGAMGASQGGGLTIARAALEPQIKKLAPIHPFLSDYKRVWEMDLAMLAYEELKSNFRLFDPLNERENEIFIKLGYIDIQHLVRRIKGEVLMAVGLMDNVCPPSTQFAVYNKITSRKNMVIYSDFGHENLPGFIDKTYQFMKSL